MKEIGARMDSLLAAEGERFFLCAKHGNETGCGEKKMAPADFTSRLATSFRGC